MAAARQRHQLPQSAEQHVSGFRHNLHAVARNDSGNEVTDCVLLKGCSGSPSSATV